ncbi:hypothetical protein DJ030_02125 [bacterium endosymbiont of Escarpia laminata]|nr:MAG: hypothetical protein DJ030_02125 [bacterium endosymbiont of Escarpia laminata]
MTEIIISIKPNFVEKILCGEKTVELRTRRANLQPGTQMWIYSTLPRGEICARASVEYVHTDKPDTIWERYSDQIAIHEDEFWAYVGQRESVSVIKMSKIDPIDSGVSLKRMQNLVEGFTPPQFFMHLKSCNPIRALLPAAL